MIPGTFGHALIHTAVRETVFAMRDFLRGRGWQSPASRVVARMSETGVIGDGIAWESFDRVSHLISAPVVGDLVVVNRPYVPMSLRQAFRWGEKFSIAYDDEDLDQCSICICVFGEDDLVREMPHCAHVFHRDCLDKWLEQRETTCPLCRTNLAM